MQNIKKDLRADELFENYELSWLKFNWRVLAEAERKDLPLLERVKFISIVCSNLDEFFQKRVGGLKRQHHAGVTDLTVDGRTPLQQLREIRKEVKKMIKRYRDCYLNLLVPEMEQQGIKFRSYNDLDKKLKAKADEYFEKQIYPIITPLAVDEAHPFPFISNKSRSLAIKLTKSGSNETFFARIKIPSNRPRWIEFGQTSESVTLLSVKDLIVQKMDRFFPGMNVVSAHVFRVTRNADLERNEEEADDLIEMIEDELRERRFAEIVRLEIDKKMPADIKSYLLKHLNVSKNDIFEMDGPIGLADTMELTDLDGFTHLKEPAWTPVLHPVFRHAVSEELPSVFKVMQQEDFIVHHPYHSFETSTQRFVEEAATDPDVLAIKQTLYRTSSDSPLMHSLMKAAEENKQVAVLVELKARFDEERNIGWAQKLEKAGVHVAYGISGLKIHTKLTIIIREENNELKRYVHIGTGNYNPDTAQLYEDIGFFTCREDIASDISDVFNLLTGYAPGQTFRKAFVAPNHLRNNISRLIKFETEQAAAGNKARIIAKMNSLEDPEIIRTLYEASQAGVETDLIVRGVCRLIPGIEGISENIRVHSVIGKFLEHSRCYYFHHAGESLCYIGSADWMHRNLDARVEVLVPVEDPSLKAYLQFILKLYLRDNVQRWVLKPNGDYKRVIPGKGDERMSAQHYLMEHAKRSAPPVPRSR